MPIPAQRDAVESARQLATWLGPKVGAEGEVTLSEFRGPGATGFSNETILVDATWTSGGTERQSRPPTPDPLSPRESRRLTAVPPSSPARRARR